MSGFDDLLHLDSHRASWLEGHTFRRTVGTSWRISITGLVDDDDALVDMTSGFVAVAKVKTSRPGLGSVAVFTTDPGTGLAVDLSAFGAVTLRATPAASSVFAAHTRRTLTLDVTVTRTRDGRKAPIAHGCYLIPLPGTPPAPGSLLGFGSAPFGTAPFGG